MHGSMVEPVMDATQKLHEGKGTTCSLTLLFGHACLQPLIHATDACHLSRSLPK